MIIDLPGFTNIHHSIGYELLSMTQRNIPGRSADPARLSWATTANEKQRPLDP